MNWILIIYLILPNEGKEATRIEGFKSRQKCFDASKPVTVIKGPGKLAFNCIKK